MPLVLERLAGGAEEAVALGDVDGRARAVDLAEGHRCAFGKARMDKGAEALADAVRILIGDEPEGKLGRGLRGDDGLGAGPGIAADDAVDLGGGAAQICSRTVKPSSPADRFSPTFSRNFRSSKLNAAHWRRISGLRSRTSS